MRTSPIRPWRDCSPTRWSFQAICGIVLFTASTLQQYGILYGKSAAGFLTAMYIVMVPLLAFVFLAGASACWCSWPWRCPSLLSADHHRWFRFDTGGYPARVHGRACSPCIFWLLSILWAAPWTPSAFIRQFCTAAVLSWAGSPIEGSVDWAGAAHSRFRFCTPASARWASRTPCGWSASNGCHRREPAC